MQQCQNQLATICNRPVLPQPISTLIGSQPDHVGQYFCPPGWLTHWLVLDAGICYRRYTLKEVIDTDEAQQVCVRHGGHLAVAPTHNIRIALEQVYAAFNNRSVVDSWIGLRNRGEQLAELHRDLRLRLTALFLLVAVAPLIPLCGAALYYTLQVTDCLVFSICLLNKDLYD